MPVKEKCLEIEELRPRVHRLFFPEKKDLVEDFSTGLELEIWPFRKTDTSPNKLVRFHEEGGTGLIDILQASQHQINGLEWAPGPGGMPRFVIGDGGQLTFEPGGQLEYSAAPQATLDLAVADISAIIESLRCTLKPHGIWFYHGGLNPWYSVDEVGLNLQKERYIHMNNYFKAKGPYGQRMMRLSTSLQVNLDAGDPQTAQRRWLAANLLTPVFTAMFGNSPFLEGKPNGAHSYRALIWQRLDPSRTGFQPGFLAEDYQPCPVTQYLDFALAADCQRLPDKAGKLVFDGRFLSFQDWMDQGSHGWFPTLEDFDMHLTTLFPNVRARGFFEVRYLDGQSKVWCAVPGIMLTHLLYSEPARERAIQLLAPYRTQLPQMEERAAIQGMTEPEIAPLTQEIANLALEAAGQIESEPVVGLCEAFLNHYTRRNRNPASDLLDLNNGQVFTPAQYREWEARQVEAAGNLLETICEYS